MKKPKLKTYHIQVQIELTTNKEVQAESLEEALAIGRELSVPDVIEIEGDHIDSEIEVTGVY